MGDFRFLSTSDHSPAEWQTVGDEVGEIAKRARTAVEVRHNGVHCGPVVDLEFSAERERHHSLHNITDHAVALTRDEDFPQFSEVLEGFS